MAEKTARPEGARPVDREQILAFRRRRQHLDRPLAGTGALAEVTGACPVQNTPPGTAALAGDLAALRQCAAAALTWTEGAA